MKPQFKAFTFMPCDFHLEKSQIEVHPLNVVAVVVEKDDDPFEEKNRRLFPETESNASIECQSCCRRKRR